MARRSGTAAVSLISLHRSRRRRPPRPRIQGSRRRRPGPPRLIRAARRHTRQFFDDHDEFYDDVIECFDLHDDTSGGEHNDDDPAAHDDPDDSPTL